MLLFFSQVPLIFAVLYYNEEVVSFEIQVPKSLLFGINCAAYSTRCSNRYMVLLVILFSWVTTKFSVKMLYNTPHFVPRLDVPLRL